MRILYIGEDPKAEYHEVSLFTELGHEVFSIGEQSLGEPPRNREILEHTTDPALVVKFWELHPRYERGGAISLHKSFTGLFDLVITSGFPTHLIMNWRVLLGKKVVWVWRTRPRTSPVHYLAVNNLKGKGLKVLELPPTGRYRVDECRELWTNFLQNL